MSAIARLDMVPLQMERDIREGHRVTIDVQGAYCCGEVLSGLSCPVNLALKILGEVRRGCIAISTWTWRLPAHEGYVPSDEIEAPESLNSSDPIWMGNTLSCGSILGILVTSSRLDGPLFDGAALGCWGRCCDKGVERSLLAWRPSIAAGAPRARWVICDCDTQIQRSSSS